MGTESLPLPDRPRPPALWRGCLPVRRTGGICVSHLRAGPGTCQASQGIVCLPPEPGCWGVTDTVVAGKFPNSKSKTHSCRRGTWTRFSSSESQESGFQGSALHTPALQEHGTCSQNVVSGSEHGPWSLGAGTWGGRGWEAHFRW